MDIPQEKMRKKVSFDLSETPTGNCCSNVSDRKALTAWFMYFNVYFCVQESKALKCSSKLKARSSSVSL